MPEILLSNQLLASNEIDLDCRADYNELQDSNDSLFAHRPYMIRQDPSFQDKAIYDTLNRSPMESLKNLTEMALSFGADNTQAIAELMVNLKEYEIALTGAGASVYSSRIGEFGAAVQRYQEVLLEYRNVAYPTPPNQFVHLWNARYAIPSIKCRDIFAMNWLRSVPNSPRARKAIH